MDQISEANFWVTISGGTLQQDNCQLIGQSLIVLTRQAQKDRNQSELLDRHSSGSRAAEISLFKVVKSFYETC